jgi:hypothetical protein
VPIPSTAGATLSKPRAVGLVAAARLGVDPDQVDLPTLVGAFDAASVRAVWRGLPGAERAGIVEYLAARHGPAVAVFSALAERHDDVLAELLVGQAITSAPGTDTHAAATLGGFLQARFVAPRPSRIDLAGAGAAAVVYAADAPFARLGQQVRHAERELEELVAPELAVHSPVLPRGFVERLAVAAQRLDEAAIADVVTHQQAPRECHRVDRLRAAVRLHRWLKSASIPQYATASEGVAHHAGELAWVDRALSQVRAGDADPRIATVLRRIERRAAEVRGGADAVFAERLAADTTTPAGALAVETVLPALVVPVVRSGPVLLLVVDGMSGAVAGDLTDAITDRRTGWTRSCGAAPELARQSSPHSLPRPRPAGPASSAQPSGPALPRSSDPRSVPIGSGQAVERSSCTRPVSPDARGPISARSWRRHWDPTGRPSSPSSSTPWKTRW